MSPKRHALLVSVLIAAACVAAFSSAFAAGFVWDDDQHITMNWNLRSAEGLARIWFEPSTSPQYYPVSQTAYWLEYQCWGLSTIPWHAVNILLHAAAAILLFQLLRRLAVPGAWFAALLFAIHPLQVETVAWLMELKSILAALFYFLALLAFIAFWEMDRPQATRPFQWKLYLRGTLAFILALLSKSVVATLPAVILLLLWYKRGAIGKRDVLLTLPLFAIAVASGLYTAFLETTHVGARGPEWAFSFLDRILIAGRAADFYAGHLLWPTPIIFFYPRWNVNAGAWWQYLFPAGVIIVLLAAWFLRRRIGRGVLTALLFFVGTLFPALGFFNVFPMRYSFVADHFQYLACIGLFALVAGAAARAAQRLPRRSQFIPYAAATIIVATLGVMTFIRGFAYHDAFTLYSDIVAQNPQSWGGQALLASEYVKRHDPAAALQHFTRAASLGPDIADNEQGVAECLLALGDADQSQRLLETLCDRFPGNAKLRNDLAGVYLTQKNPAAAERLYRQALALDPTFAQSHYNLANILAQTGRFAPAADEFAQALRFRPEWPEAFLLRGRCLAATGRLPDAIEQFQQALALRPNWPEAQADLQRARAMSGQSAPPLRSPP